jgi:hypothetical protein
MIGMDYRASIGLCVFGAFAFFNLAFILRRFELRQIPPPTFAHLSSQQRLKRKRIAVWISIANGCVCLGGALFLLLLRNRSN